MVIINIITLIVLVGGGIGAYYYYNQTENYLKTDNAKIDGKVIPIASPVAGKLTDWKAEVGKNYNENDKLGAVTVAAANGEQTVDVTIPQNANSCANQTQQQMLSLEQVARLLMHLI